MRVTVILSLITCFLIGIFLGIVFLLLRWLLYKGFRKENVPHKQETERVRRSLGEVLKDHRGRCGMTQEFMAEALGVSRQAVSKWENGTSDPSTANLLALAKLYGVDPGELLKNVEY